MADASIDASAVGTMVQLEGPTLLRHSKLWQLQKNYYESYGLKCWTEARVPNFVTSNAFLANTYAKVIMGYIRDFFRCAT